jgi:hypothetical protein
MAVASRFRQQVGRDHPHLMWRTTALVLVTLVPGALVLLGLLDWRI